MDLIHNNLLQINSGEHSGLHRIILADTARNLIILNCINRFETEESTDLEPKTLKKNKHEQTVPMWLHLNDIEDLQRQGKARVVGMQLSGYYLSPLTSKTANAIWQRRLEAMKDVLNFTELRRRLLIDLDIGGLMRDVQKYGNYSKTTAYSLFQLVCTKGFSENSLKPVLNKRGGPNKKRPVGTGRKKAGAKTIKQLISKESGILIDADQPGVTQEWINLCLAGDKLINLPKPNWSTRHRLVLDSMFVKDWEFNDGVCKPKNLVKGDYPNLTQFKWILNFEYSRLEKLQHKTTKRNFPQNHRGLIGYSFNNAIGPGHLYAIDATVGDVFLRSSINPAWFLGRPIVYVVVDVWSTAVVGFYVCVNAPSWPMAQLAIFCAIAGPEFTTGLRGVDFRPVLNPRPTMPADWLFDRGEGLSLKSDKTANDLKMPARSWTPPYRGDLKGIAEVLHRIQKDKLQKFVFGAIDARAVEYELLKFDPRKAVFNIKQFTSYLYTLFRGYNSSLSRVKRLDSYMISQDCVPSPAGLWNWGHANGLGIQIARSDSDLISALLPTAPFHSTAHGFYLDGLHYTDGSDQDHLAATLARGYGSTTSEAHFFPGNVNKIWVPNAAGEGMSEYGLSRYSTAIPGSSFDEYRDALHYDKAKNSFREHENTLILLGNQHELNTQHADAILSLKDIIPSNIEPTVNEAKVLERSAELRKLKPPESSIQIPVQNSDLKLLHANSMANIVAAARQKQIKS